MAITISGTNGIVGAGFTVDNSGVSVTAGIGTFSSIQGSGANLTALPAANLTGSLPAISAANCTNIPAANITGTLPAISGANLTGISAGITDADQWRVTSNFSISGAGDIASNWERNDTYFDKIGTGMSESSGIFTFPSTGIWRIVACFNANASTMQYSGVIIKATTDNSSYSEIGLNYDSATGTAYFMSIVADAIFDCTNTSTHKVKLSYNTQGSTTFEGESAKQRSGVTFIRLGDT